MSTGCLRFTGTTAFGPDLAKQFTAKSQCKMGGQFSSTLPTSVLCKLSPALSLLFIESFV